MHYLSKTLENFKKIPSLSPLASVRDHSPPTNGGKWSRNGGTGWGKVVFRYDSNNYIYLERKKQNKKTAVKSLNQVTRLAILNELAVKSKLLKKIQCNDFLPQYFRSDLTGAISLCRFFKFTIRVIEFNHIIKNLTKGVSYEEFK